MHDRYWYTILGGWLAGVGLRSQTTGAWSWGPGLFWTLCVAGLVGLLWVLVSYVRRGQWRRVLLAGSLFVLLSGIGGWYLDATFAADRSGYLDQLLGEAVVVQGLVSEDPDEREGSTRLTVSLEAVALLGSDDVPGPPVPLSDVKVLVIANSYPRYRYGDRVLVTGKLREPENFTGETQREFDYVNFLAKDDIFYTMSFVEVAIIERGGGSAVKRALLDLKRGLVDALESAIVQPEGALAAGELFGERGGLGGTLSDDFRRTGVIHVVVLSGYNVTIVADAIVRSLSFLSIRLGMVLGIFGIVGFAILTGAGATIVRASVMAILVIIARFFGRPYAVSRALWLAAGLMVLHNPKILWFDISFQLSFLATLGLLHVAPIIEARWLSSPFWRRWLPSRFGIRENFVATLSTQIFVLPLILYSMGELSLVSIPVNMLVLVVVPATMLLSIMTAVGAILSPVLGMVLMVPTYGLLTYQIRIVEWFARLPLASVTLPPFGVGWMVLAYAGLLWWVWRSGRRLTPESSARLHSS